MRCQDKVNLATQYKITAASYSYAVSELARSVRIFDTAGYNDLFRLARNAGRISHDAETDLEQHVLGHGC
jgi:hypothetical protein